MAVQVDVDSSCDEASSSLGDSAYDFIDDKSVLTTDDEHEDHMTGSSMSSDGACRKEPSRSAPIHYPTPPPEPNAEDKFDLLASTLKTPLQHSKCNAARDLPQEDDDVFRKLTKIDLDAIIFKEPCPWSQNISEVSYPLDDALDFKHVNNRETDRDASPTRRLVSVSLRQSMMPSSLNVQGRVFKILFFGPSACKDEITHKIASALAAVPTLHGQQAGRADHSRYNIVPVSGLENGQNPEIVLIDSSGLELDVEELAATSTYLTRDMQGEVIRLNLTNGKCTTSIPDGGDFVVSNGWSLPDLVVLWIPSKTCSQSAWTSLQTRSDVREYMRRHRIPVLDIAESINTNESRKDTPNIDRLTPHICLQFEQVHSGGYQFYTCETSPVDLVTFLKIDASQLNRSLACLPATHIISKKQDGSMQKTVISYIQRAQAFLASPRSIPLTLLLLAGMLLTLHIISDPVTSENYGKLIVPSITTTAMTEYRETSVMSQPSLLTTRPSLSSSPPAVMPVSITTLTGLTDQTDLASFLLDADTMAPNKLEQFKIYILGDCHIVLRPPHWFVKAKEAAPLLFRDSRDKAPIEYHEMILFEGIHALQIPRKEAYGLLAVNVWTRNRPLLNETINVDFGSSWLKIAAWKRAVQAMGGVVQNDLDIFSKTLGGIYDQTTTDLTVIVERTKDKVIAQINAEMALRASQFNRKTLRHFLPTTTDLSHLLWRRFHDAQRSASRHIHLLSKGAMRNASTYTDSHRHTASYLARVFARAAAGIDVRRLSFEIYRLNGKHLRNAQKKALKAWWTFKGVPWRSEGIEVQRDARSRT